uniref:Adaptor protein ClpS core domain-containing protein n=1 Tax=Phaeomonas parva TaxID=124430 RepID=A0A7S1TWE5_9STRA|mmetsp:Transcript_17888/g.54757  ORF Transcript_17888/g.54757 Transcript_17888/m.54757 type:complete len:165 (+) Transcript_17888:143-637(+)
MRVVFVAALLALCLGGADAFAPMAPRRTLAKRASALNMAKIGRSGPEIEGSSKVLVKTIDKVDEKVEEKQKEDLDKEQWWRVLLHNDEIHTFEYVIEEIVGTVPTVTRRKAFDMAMTTHRDGQATVAIVWKKLAEQYCLGLQKAGLTSSIAPDANFKNSSVGRD